MKMPFWKMHGAGNDFIILQDTQTVPHPPTPSQIQAWCQHHTGIGADGLLLLCPPVDPANHFRMQFFNPDGKEADMCGNGARCIARFAYDQKIAPATMQFETASGTVSAHVQHQAVTLHLPPPKTIILDQTVVLHDKTLQVDYADTGVPHVVVTCPDVAAIDIRATGAAIRQHDQYAPQGTNVDFIQILDNSTLLIRTYERGVEDETLACGTGVAAAAVVALRKARVQSPVRIQTAGGDILTITATITSQTIHNLQLTGPAVHVFHGYITLPMETST